MENNFRSACPIASALDLMGDKWTMLIIRDMLLGGKKTFKDISSSQEGIATNILSSRFKLLESFGIITKRKLPDNKKENIYLLTEKGIDLAPMVLEIVLWSDKYVREFNPQMFPISLMGFNAEKSSVIDNIQTNYRDLVRTTIG